MQSLKIPFIVIIFFFACLFLLPKIFGPIPFTVQNINSGKPDVFRVDAVGEASAIPDTAVLTLGMTSENRSLSAAQQQTNTVMNKLTQELKKMGIAEKDIKTIQYTVYPNLSDTVTPPLPAADAVINPVPEATTRMAEDMVVKELPASMPQLSVPLPPGVTPRSYTVTSSLEVKVKSLEKVDQIIDMATAAGANQVGGISFTFDDATKKKLEEKARNDALTQAKEKAESLAKAGGLSLGKIVDIQAYPDSSGGGYYGREVSMMNKDGSTSVNPGEGTIRVTVNLAYEIR